MLYNCVVKEKNNFIFIIDSDYFLWAKEKSNYFYTLVRDALTNGCQELPMNLRSVRAVSHLIGANQ